MEREVRNLLRCGSCCPGIDGRGFGAVVAVAAGVGAGVGAAVTVAALSLPNVLWWTSSRSQVG